MNQNLTEVQQQGLAAAASALRCYDMHALADLLQASAQDRLIIAVHHHKHGATPCPVILAEPGPIDIEVLKTHLTIKDDQTFEFHRANEDLEVQLVELCDLEGVIRIDNTEMELDEEQTA